MLKLLVYSSEEPKAYPIKLQCNPSCCAKPSLSSRYQDLPSFEKPGLLALAIPTAI